MQGGTRRTWRTASTLAVRMTAADVHGARQPSLTARSYNWGLELHERCSLASSWHNTHCIVLVDAVLVRRRHLALRHEVLGAHGPMRRVAVHHWSCEAPSNEG